MWIEINKLSVTICDCRFGEIHIENDYICFFACGSLLTTEKFAFDLLSTNLTHQMAQSCFRNGYFICLVNKETSIVTVLRDTSGLKSGYYYQDKDLLIISTNVHRIAKHTKSSISQLWADCFIYNYFILDGYTLYNNISEFKIGEKYVNNVIKDEIVSTIDDLPIEYQENDYTEQQNIKLLYAKTLETHDKLKGDANVVYLSGGIDSNVMLASLYNVCPNKLRAVSYKVKEGKQDETLYAEKVAKHFGVPFTIIERDPFNPMIVDKYEDYVLSLNNPYDGMFIFAPVFQQENELFFAGQDTRLHTPPTSKLEKHLLLKIQNGNYEGISTDKLVHYAVEFYRKYPLFAKPIANFFDPVETLNYLYWSLSKSKYIKYGFHTNTINELKKIVEIKFEEKVAKDRAIYNQIVHQRWYKQYTNDIKYMVDMGFYNHASTILPFYDTELVRFSSTIPWEICTKQIIGTDKYSQKNVYVDKYALRKAFEKDLPNDVLYRAKATSNDYLLMYNGVIGKKILQIIEADVNNSHSFIKDYLFYDYYSEYIKNNNKKFFSYRICKMILYLSFMCIYYKNIQ